MAGGKGSRFGENIEKPMAQFLGKSLIRRVIEATKESKKIADTYVAITDYSPKTAYEADSASVKVIKTDGKGYHSDAQQAVQKANLTCPVLIISADLPFINGGFLDEIISEYEKSDKPALTVLIPKEAFSEYGLSAVSLYEHEGKKFAVSGINIVDGRRILEEQEQEVVVSCRPEAVFNVNAIKDLEQAKKYLLRKNNNKNKT